MSSQDPDALWAKILDEADSIGLLKGGWRMGDGLRHLVSVEPRFQNWVIQSGIPRIFVTPLDEKLSPFSALAKIIVLQQISVAAGKSIFHLQRGNVLALGDLGVRRGIAKLYDLGTDWRKKKEAEFRPLVSNWAPFASLGSALMWKAEDVVLSPPPPVHDAQSTSSSKRKTGDDCNPLRAKKRR